MCSYIHHYISTGARCIEIGRQDKNNIYILYIYIYVHHIFHWLLDLRPGRSCWDQWNVRIQSWGRAEVAGASGAEKGSAHGKFGGPLASPIRWFFKYPLEGINIGESLGDDFEHHITVNHIWAFMPCPSINLIQTFVKECILCWSFQFLLLGTCTPDAIDSGSSRIGTLVVRCCAQDAITSYLDRLRLQIRKEGRPKRATCCNQNYGSFWKGTHWHHWFWMCLACVETCMLEVCIVSTLAYCTCFSLYFWILRRWHQKLIVLCDISTRPIEIF